MDKEIQQLIAMAKIAVERIDAGLALGEKLDVSPLREAIYNAEQLENQPLPPAPELRVEDILKILDRNTSTVGVDDCPITSRDKAAKELLSLFQSAQAEAVRQGEYDKQEYAHFVISHIWQFARGTGYPLKWTITDSEFKSVLKHYGIKYGEERQALSNEG